jgi:cytosine/adenosine deaminase-related metal-dependent hydrolase
VISGGAEPHVLEDAAVRVVGGHIAQVGPAGGLAVAHPEEMWWPARGRVLMPGLVNTHAHLARHLARGLGLQVADAWERYDRALDVDDVHHAAFAALVEGVRHGVTTVCDFHRSSDCIGSSLAKIVQAAERLGVRVALCYGADEHDPADRRRAAFEASADCARQVAAARTGSTSVLLGLRFGSAAGFERMVAEALEIGGDGAALHFDMTLDATPAERWPARLRWPTTASPSLWAHAERAPRALLGAVRERGDALSATGPAAATALVREVEPSWGTDAGLNAPPAALPEESGAIATAFSPAQYRRLWVNGPVWAAAHFGSRLGVIEPGAPADLVLRDYQPATELSPRTLRAHWATGLLRAPVSGVMVAGEIVMDNGVIVTVDEAEVAARARERARQLWHRLDSGTLSA